jgi:hypothetical protein
VTVSAKEVLGNPTIGIVFAGISGSGVQLVESNNISGSLYGYLLADVNPSAPLAIHGGSITSVMQGVAAVNYNLALSAQKTSAFTVDGVTMSGFTGTSVNAGRNLHAGIYVFTGGSDASATVTGIITNVTVTGTGKISPDSAGVDLADFSTGAGVRQQIIVVNCNISTNKNRGVFVRRARGGNDYWRYDCRKWFRSVWCRW